MCDCPKDKINELVSSSRRDDATNGAETPPQRDSAREEPVNRRPKQGCCRRVLTYEDEVTELPISLPIPQTPGSPALRPSELVGVAIARRIDYNGASSDRKDESASKKADEGTTSEDKTQQQPKDSEKEGVDGEEEGESPADAATQQADKDDQTTQKQVVTSTPCPGQLNPNNECNCSVIPKT